jgi:hypothetical protein
MDDTGIKLTATCTGESTAATDSGAGTFACIAKYSTTASRQIERDQWRRVQCSAEVSPDHHPVRVPSPNQCLRPRGSSAFRDLPAWCSNTQRYNSIAIDWAC